MIYKIVLFHTAYHSPLPLIQIVTAKKKKTRARPLLSDQLCVLNQARDTIWRKLIG